MQVLVADDDAVTRKLLTASLTKWGYTVIEVSNGIEALNALEAEKPPPLAVIDWIMPGMDGVDICRRVHQTQRDETCYIILLTARSTTQDIITGLDAGANDYIIKPFDSGELQARVNVGKRVVELEVALRQRVTELKDALKHIKTLQGILPICMYCHRIRTDEESWQKLEHYIQEHSEAQFSHSLCPECLEKYYPKPQDYDTR
ncbi:MAG TPA: response regulator [Candidatus Hydrogenedentes bacterium]|nr:response regulator [Candidatus Hydrogenedentota bacterium]HOL75446.1 response regulator [Candidatus Hydrogenedentota bacterium]HPO84955.1 response regulator [Candidatus Hydrogenedentota bacterium]